MKELEILFKNRMGELDGFIQTDEIYKEDMEDFDGVIKLWKLEHLNIKDL